MASPLLQNLLTLLEMEQLEENIFRGESQDLGTGRVFGGQVLGQAISAVQKSCPERFVHSAHAYFLRAGDCEKPIVYLVNKTRDGRTFSSRTVTAIQNGEPIFTLLCSLQGEEEGTFDFSLDRDLTPCSFDSPDNGAISVDLENEGIDTFKYRNDRSKILQSLPFQITFPSEEADNQSQPEQFWLRTSSEVPKNGGIHQSILAFASDFRLLPSTLRAVGYRYRVSEAMLATICHAIWFHRPSRVDDWMFHLSEPLSLSNGRGLARGEIYNSDGQLVASTMQEGVVRKLRS